MTNKELSEAIFKVADGFYALAEALAGRAADEAPERDERVPEVTRTANDTLITQARAASLGTCPTHHVAWAVKPAGISKSGNAYDAFWHCPERMCPEKPVKVWRETHAIRDA